MFGLISKRKLRREIGEKALLVYGSQNTLKKRYKDKDISEWAFYKQLWNIRGKLELLEDLINSF